MHKTMQYRQCTIDYYNSLLKVMSKQKKNRLSNDSPACPPTKFEH